MAEQLDLTTPTTKTTNSWSVSELHLFRTPIRVHIIYKSSQGELVSVVYADNPAPVSGKTGADVVKDINTGNFSVNSLQKRILQLGAQDGYIGTGTVSGTPD